MSPLSFESFPSEREREREDLGILGGNGCMPYRMDELSPISRCIKSHQPHEVDGQADIGKAGQSVNEREGERKVV